MVKPLTKSKQQKKLSSSKSKETSSKYRLIRNATALNLNAAPKTAQFDDSMSRKTRQIAKLKELAKVSGKRSKKVKKNTDLVTATATKYGFQRRSWETDKAFQKRINIETKLAVDDGLLKARYGLGGRDVNKIRDEYKVIDKAELQKRNLKLLMKEKRQRLLNKKKSKSEFNEIIPSPKNEEENGAEKFKESTYGKTSQKERRLTQKERKKLSKREATEARKHEFMLNAREMIPFGEVASAPPQFKGAFKAKINSLSAQAGSKDLLLKKFLKSDESGSTNTQSISPSTKVVCKNSIITETERQNVVDFYREIKKKRLGYTPLN